MAAMIVIVERGADFSCLIISILEVRRKKEEGRRKKEENFSN
ncbi:hypothetical protein [Okeania sp. SIO1I7]|nr:hypothetical protein [Okeania sp. SIO1I7]